MDWIKKIVFILLVNLSFTSILFGQSNEEPMTSNDFWTGVSFKYKLNKKIGFNLDNQVRITDNLNSIRSTFFEFGVKYKFNKYFSARAQHRYVIRNNERHVNRFTLDATGRWKIKPVKLELSYRLRFQHGVVTFTKEPSSLIRNRFQVRYTLSKKLKLFAKYESFYQFNDKNRFRQNLLATGFVFEIKKQLDLSIFYRFDQRINTKNPKRTNIIAFLVTYEI